MADGAAALGYAGRAWPSGLTPGMAHAKDGLTEQRGIIEAGPVAGMRMMASRQSKHGDDVGVVGGESGSFIYGRWYEPAELADLDLESAIADAAVSLQPVFHRLRTEAGWAGTACRGRRARPIRGAVSCRPGVPDARPMTTTGRTGGTSPSCLTLSAFARLMSAISASSGTPGATAAQGRCRP